MADAAVSAHGLTVRYGDVLALDGVDLDIAPGRICGLLGTNGSGKTTLLTSVLGLTSPQRGTVRLHGASPARARTRGLVGYVPQSEHVDWAFPIRVRDVVMMGRYRHMGPTRRPRRADHAAVDAALRRADLTPLARRQIGALSGGQRKRAFLARAIAQDPAVLLLDEPFAGVDRASEATIGAVLTEMRQAGHTIVISTHDLAGAPSFCDEAVLLQRRVLAHGPAASVLTPERLAEVFGITTTSEVA